MSVTVKCGRCGNKRVAFASNVFDSPVCRFCAERWISERLGRVVLLTPRGKDSNSGKTFEQLVDEANRKGR